MPKVWSTWKIHKDLTFKPESSQNGRFQEETGRRELFTQNGSLMFKTEELEHELEQIIPSINQWLQYLFSWLFKSIKLLQKETNKKFELCLWTQIVQAVLELLRSAFFFRRSTVTRTDVGGPEYVSWFFENKKSIKSVFTI